MSGAGRSRTPAPAAAAPAAPLPYQTLLDQIRRGEPDQATLLRRVSELVSLVDLVGTLGSGLTSEQILESALLIVMGQLQCTRGALLVRSGSAYRVQAGRGLPAGAPREVTMELSADAGVLGREAAAARALLEALDLDIVCPVVKAEAPVAAIALGGRAGGRGFGGDEADFLRTVAACAAAPLESGLIYQELRRLNRRLSVKVFQLHSLFDISRELVASLDEDAILQVLSAALMGHLMATRCAIYLPGAGGLRLAHERGTRLPDEARHVPRREASAVLAGLRSAVPVGALPEGALREALLSARMALAVPVGMEGVPEGVLAVGERASGEPFADEDLEFAITLARQGAAALQTVRLHRVRVQKQRQDRELQIARGIQQSLFPAVRPVMDGYDLAATSIPCYEVGGDYYDFIPLPGGRWALAVADVSGKGTPASLLMASVHAWLRALAGTAAPAMLMERLNRFLCESTEPHRYVTFFYAELDPHQQRLVYVNGGHVPPFLLRADGGRERLLHGGPALGLIEDGSYEPGQAALEPGDVLALVTDGVTETVSPEEQEPGDTFVFDALASARGADAVGILDALVRAVQGWAGAAGCADDLTALILKALPRP